MTRPSAVPHEFGDRYQILRQLGEGGMGIVYEALDKERGVHVALKTTQRLDAAALYSFKQEFRALADVNHPNLVALYDLVAEKSLAFFTMELVEGKGLLEYVRGEAGRTVADTELAPKPVARPHTPTEHRVPVVVRKLHCDLPRLRAALRQLADGVAALHASGKLHRDLKPSNVLVTAEGRVVVLDFGLAVDLAAALTTTLTGHVAGTAEYMSPEQAASGELTEATDWYSIGVMLFEALTGTVPFGGSYVQVLLEKQRYEPPPPSQLVDGVPSDLDGLCADLLRTHPKDRPPGAEILRRLGAKPQREGGSRGATTGTFGAPFIGRDGHMRALDAAFAESLRGRTVLLHVHGSSGMGKTALLARFVDLLPARSRALVLAGRCYERESVSFKAFDSLVDALTSHLRRLPSADVDALLPNDCPALVRVFPVLARVEPIAALRRRTLDITDLQEVRRRAFRAFRELLARMTDRSPVVLWIDDVQWGDVDSAALLGELFRPTEPPPLLLILSYRTEEADEGPLLRALRDRRIYDTSAADVRELEVGPLELGEATRLAEMYLGEPLREKAELVAREAHGNPYFVDELVRHVVSGEGLAGGVVRLDEAIHRRVARLPEDARRLLSLVAVAGGPVAENLAIRATEIAITPARRALSSLRREHLLRGALGGTAVDAFHDRVRQSVLARLEPEAKTRLHQRLALVLLASGDADPDALVVHFRAAGDREREMEFVVAAAEKAVQALAFDRAAGLFRRAIELRLATDDEQRELRQKLADALAWAGRFNDAALVNLELSVGASALEALDRRRRAAEQYLCCGQFESGAALLDGALREVGERSPRAPVAVLFWLIVTRVLLWLRGLEFVARSRAPGLTLESVRLDVLWSAGTGFSMTDNARGAYFQARNLLLSLQAGDRRDVFKALVMEVLFRSSEGVQAKARVAALLARVEHLASELDGPLPQATMHIAHGWTSYMAGAWTAAELEVEQGEQIVRAGVPEFRFQLATAGVILHRALVFRGDLRALRKRVPPILGEAEQLGDAYTLTNLWMGPLLLLGLADDAPERVREELERVAAHLHLSGRFLLQHFYLLLAQVQLALYCSDPSSALDLIRANEGRLRRSLVLRVQTVRCPFWDLRIRALVALAVAVPSQRERALQRARADVRRLEKEGSTYATAFAVMGRALIAHARGERPEATRLFADAVDAFDVAGMQLHAATARYRLGSMAGGEEGRAVLAQAMSRLLEQGVRNPERFAALFAPTGPAAVEVSASRP